MQEKRNKRLLISFIGMVMLSVGLYFFESRDRANVDASLFKVEDVSKINKVALTASSGQVLLEYNGTRWMVNKKYEADRQLIKLLFATLEKVEAKRAISGNQLDSVNAIISRGGVEVQLYENESLLQSFRAGGNVQKTESYFQKTKDELPYIVTIPGYRLYVSYILELDENGWRDKRVFNFNWRNFKSLNTVIPNDPSQNFEASFKDQFFGITNMAAVDTTKLNDYLDAVSLLSADQFIRPGFSALYDSLVNTSPSLRVEIKDIADKVYSLALYPRLRNDPFVLGKTGENDLLLFNRNSILPIARKRNYFIAR